MRGQLPVFGWITIRERFMAAWTSKLSSVSESGGRSSIPLRGTSMVPDLLGLGSPSWGRRSAAADKVDQFSVSDGTHSLAIGHSRSIRSAPPEMDTVIGSLVSLGASSSGSLVSPSQPAFLVWCEPTYVDCDLQTARSSWTLENFPGLVLAQGFL